MFKAVGDLHPRLPCSFMSLFLIAFYGALDVVPLIASIVTIIVFKLLERKESMAIRELVKAGIVKYIRISPAYRCVGRMICLLARDHF
jgi:hypothetical protein